jgi:flavin reductase (DIM6/NTAB) family NADH-FMN oxidoreductase RutF
MFRDTENTARYVGVALMRGAAILHQTRRDETTDEQDRTHYVLLVEVETTHHLQRDAFQLKSASRVLCLGSCRDAYLAS